MGIGDLAVRRSDLKVTVELKAATGSLAWVRLWQWLLDEGQSHSEAERLGAGSSKRPRGQRGIEA